MKGGEGERELVCVRSVEEAWGPLVHRLVGNVG